MNINEMTRKDFENLEFTQFYGNVECDCMVILPKKVKHDSGFAYYSAILCKDGEPVVKLKYYDTFLFFSNRNVVRGVDVLYKSMLTRVFFEKKFKVDSFSHQIYCY